MTSRCACGLSSTVCQFLLDAQMMADGWTVAVLAFASSPVVLADGRAAHPSCICALRSCACRRKSCRISFIRVFACCSRRWPSRRAALASAPCAVVLAERPGLLHLLLVRSCSQMAERLQILHRLHMLQPVAAPSPEVSAPSTSPCTVPLRILLHVTSVGEIMGTSLQVEHSKRRLWRKN